MVIQTPGLVVKNDLSYEDSKPRVLAGSEAMPCSQKGHAAGHGIPAHAPTAFSAFTGWPFALRRSGGVPELDHAVATG